MTKWLSEQEQRAWRGFLRMHGELMASLARDLTESGLSPAEFEVLVNLTDVPDRRVRVTELAKGMRWERSRLSHQLTRMEKRGLITREECPSDARGAFAVLTGTGLAAIETASPGHVAAVRRRMFDLLTPEEVETLQRISDRVLAGLALSEQAASESDQSESTGEGVSKATICSSSSGM